MPSSTQTPPGEQGARWFWSFASLAIYAPIAKGLIKASKRESLFSGFPSPFHVLLLGPPLCALCAVLTLIYIDSAQTRSSRASVFWWIFLLCAFLGWPISCATGGALTVGGHNLIAH